VSASRPEPGKSTTPPEIELLFRSTTFAWRRVKIARPPEAMGTVRRSRSFWWGRPPLDPRKPVTLTIKLRGGPECWVEIHSRGCIGRFPGVTSIYDILREITQSK
jgi:hypothetical protein